ncbi:MAG: rhodanese-like domain-containing protein [Chromatiales bacterium]|nr:rhodanese-like domain-containing protein [Chromatiales bacterium]
MMKSNMFKGIVIAAAASVLVACGATTPEKSEGADLAVKITPKMGSATVSLNGSDVTIQRNQDQKNMVNPDFAKTSRKCPPFCIRPISTAKGVETIAELEVIDYIKQVAAGKNVLLVDNRTPDWHAKGTIPGAVNVPFTKINRSKGADDVSLAEALELFGAEEAGKGWNFSNAKTLVMFCNGMWCGQSPLGIDGIMDMGYPAEKIKWYRGGMQDWEILGLTTVKP